MMTVKERSGLMLAAARHFERVPIPEETDEGVFWVVVPAFGPEFGVGTDSLARARSIAFAIAIEGSVCAHVMRAGPEGALSEVSCFGVDAGDP